MRYLVFDTETTGLPPRNSEGEYSKSDPSFSDWPFVLQLSWLIWDSVSFTIVKVKDVYVQHSNEITISAGAQEKHGITLQHLEKYGIDVADVLNEFSEDIVSCHYLVSHNLRFDMEMMQCEYSRRGLPNPFLLRPLMRFCTMEHGKPLCKISRFSASGNSYIKSPNLSELHSFLFPDSPPPLENLHNSLVDVLICCRSAIKMISGEDICLKIPSFWEQFTLFASPSPSH